MDSSKYKRILIKFSGEAFSSIGGFGLDLNPTKEISEHILDAYKMGVQICIVLGGGNIWRGAKGWGPDFDRVTGDYMGMLATVINALAFQSVLEKQGLVTRVMSAINLMQLAEPYIRRRAIRHLEKGRVVIFAGGTGNPYFTTDSAAALRAIEVEAEVIFKATKVDGVYSADPVKVPAAVKYDSLTYQDVLTRHLKVMDSTAVSLCMDNNLPIVVFNMNKKGSVKSALLGEKIGTIISDK